MTSTTGHFVLARRGRRAAELHHPSQGNVIDGPALTWLAHKPEPRIWVCDGHVTGIGDRAGYELSDEAFGMARENNIIRVDDAAGAHELLRRVSSRSKV